MSEVDAGKLHADYYGSSGEMESPIKQHQNANSGIKVRSLLQVRGLGK
jgi:hypothetical protein